jgi:hypothetical protein
VEKHRKQFPRLAYRRWADRIMDRAIECDPGDPDGYDVLLIGKRQFRYLENRHGDMEAVYLAAEKLRDVLGTVS